MAVDKEARDDKHSDQVRFAFVGVSTTSLVFHTFE